MRKSLSSLTLLALMTPAASAAEDAHGDAGFLPEWLTHSDTNMAFAALVIFLLIMWRVGAFKMLTSALDKRAETIETQLNEAKDLREAAAKMLADAERQQKQANKDAEQIIAQAKTDAEALMVESRETLAERLKRREALAEARIEQAANEATAEVRRAAADAATKAAQAILTEQAGVDQFEAAASEIEKALN